MRPLRIFTMVWGETHTDWFERACARSLAWPKNQAAIRGSTWNIMSKKEDSEKVLKIAQSVGVKTLVYTELPAELEGNAPNMGHYMLQALLAMMNVCLKDGSQLLTAPPDTIFSDGTIQNLIQMAKYGATCVAVPHARVSPSIFGSLKDGALSGPELVRRLFKHAHKSWSLCEIGLRESCSFVGGISWQKLDQNLYAVQHRLPTVYLSNFTAGDLSFFQQPHDGYPPVYGYWDHVWPTLLVKDQRQRTVGSSDAAFILEVTKEDLNVPPMTQSNPHEPDAFWRNEYHNGINRQFSYIMRGE